MHSAHASHAVLGGSSTCSFLTRFAVDEGQNHWSSGKLGFGIPPPVRTARLEAQSSTRHRYSSQIRAYLSSASEALLPWEYQLFQSAFLPVNPPYTSPKKLHGKMTIGMNTSEKY